MDLLTANDTLEIDVLDLRLVGMPLGIAQHHLLNRTFYIDVQHRGVKGLPVQQMVELVVIQRDRGGILTGTIDDARQLASATQAAARTRSLILAL